jgi:hypothetical protein
MSSLSECIQNLFRNFIVPRQRTNNPIQMVDIVETIVEQCPVALEPAVVDCRASEETKVESENNLEEPEPEDIYADLPDLITIVPEQYETDDELHEVDSDQSDSDYRY